MDFKEFRYSDVEATDYFEWTYYNVEILVTFNATDLVDGMPVIIEAGEIFESARIDWECEQPKMIFSKGDWNEYSALVELILR